MSIKDPKWYEAKYEIAVFALPLIAELKQKTSGVPNKLYIKYEYVTSYAEQMSLALKEWKEILGKIEYSFQLAADDDTDVIEENQDKFDEGLQLFADWFFHLWD